MLRRGPLLICALTAIAMLGASEGAARYEASSLTVTIKQRKCGLTRHTIPAGAARIRVRNLAGGPAVFRATGRIVTVAPGRMKTFTALLPTGSVGYRCAVRGRRVGRGSIRVALPPLVPHRVAVRDAANGTRELYVRQNGQRFVPRGANYVRLAALTLPGGTPFTGHSTFNVGRYSAAAAERALTRLRASRYDTVRVFLATECESGCAIDATTGRLSGDYFANVADFLHRADAHGVFVILTAGFLAGDNLYTRQINAGAGPQVQNINVNYLSNAGIVGNARFWQNVIHELRRFGAPTRTILAFDLRDELHLDQRSAPFSLSSGTFAAPSGFSYNLASAADKARLLDDALVYYIDRLRAAIRTVDPSALISASFFAPQGPNAWRTSDPRIVQTRGAIERSSADIVELHGFPGAGLSLAQLLQNFGVTATTRKPLLLGAGASRTTFPTVNAGAATLLDWQRQTCHLAFDGWLTWTWDTEEQPDLWNALSGGGVIERTLAPSLRPDPCT